MPSQLFFDGDDIGHGEPADELDPGASEAQEGRGGGRGSAGSDAWNLSLEAEVAAAAVGGGGSCQGRSGVAAFYQGGGAAAVAAVDGQNGCIGTLSARIQGRLLAQSMAAARTHHSQAAPRINPKEQDDDVDDDDDGVIVIDDGNDQRPRVSAGASARQHHHQQDQPEEVDAASPTRDRQGEVGASPAFISAKSGGLQVPELVPGRSQAGAADSWLASTSKSPAAPLNDLLDGNSPNAWPSNTDPAVSPSKRPMSPNYASYSGDGDGVDGEAGHYPGSVIAESPAKRQHQGLPQHRDTSASLINLQTEGGGGSAQGLPSLQAPFNRQDGARRNGRPLPANDNSDGDCSPIAITQVVTGNPIIHTPSFKPKPFVVDLTLS